MERLFGSFYDGKGVCAGEPHTWVVVGGMAEFLQRHKGVSRGPYVGGSWAAKKMQQFGCCRLCAEQETSLLHLAMAEGTAYPVHQRARLSRNHALYGICDQ